MKLSIFRMQPIKKINILRNIKTYIMQNQKENLQHLDWLFNASLEDFQNTIDTKLVVNDKMHFCVRINKKTAEEYDLQKGKRKDRHEIEMKNSDHV